MLDTTFWTLVTLLAVLSLLAWQRGGSELLTEGLAGGGRMLLRYGLMIAVSFLAAGLAERLMPTESVQRWFGRDAGVRGIIIATVAGALTPAGPFVSMPLAAVMLRSGAAHSAVVAFVMGWSLLAVHRFVAWEIPILGMQFASIRYVVSLGLPIAVGLGLRWFARI